jgi:hypothetical protein
MPRRFFFSLPWPAAVLAAAMLAGCAAFAPAADAPVDRRAMALLPADALLLGEQHDAPEHLLLFG